jgi:DNA-binding LacI/PurR family transcriptional regulator
MLKKKTRLKDIAEEAGVSLTTVSAVYNDNPNIKISDEMREHISVLLRKANYPSRKKTASKKLKKPLNIRIMTDFPVDNNMRGEILAGIEETLLPEEGKMLISESEKALTLLHKDPETFLKGIDGVIFISKIDEKSLQILKEKHFPVAVIGTGDIRDDVDMAYPQYYEYVPKALAHLKKLGHEKIAFVTGTMPHYCHERSIMFFKELAPRMGIKNPEENIYAMQSPEEIYMILKKALESKNRPTAIIGQLAFSKSYVESLGFKVPEDVSILCFDVPGPKESPVSFFGTDNKRLGAEGVELIKQRIKEPGSLPRHLSLPIFFVDNKTCAKI